MTTEKALNLRMMCKGVKLDDRTQGYVRKRIEKIERFLKKVLEYEAEVCMDKKGKFRVEIMARTPYKLYRAEEISESIEGSADAAVEDILNQVTRDKDKLKDIRKRGARSLKKKMVLDKSARFRK